MRKASLIGLAFMMNAATMNVYSQPAPGEKKITSIRIAPLKGLASVLNDSASLAKLLEEKVLTSEPKTVKLEDELNALFEQNFCKLDKDFLKKFKKAQAKQIAVESAIPSDVYKAIGASALNSQVKKVSDTDANAALHFFMIPENGSSEKRKIYMDGPETYYRRSASEYMDAQKGDFAFTTDCASYLNTAIDAGAKAPFGGVDSLVKTAMSNKFSTLVMRAHVYAPAAAAIAPDVGSSPLTKAERLDILFAIIAELNNYALGNNVVIDENLQISAWRKVNLLWASNEGQSTFTGNVDINTAGAGGLGVAAITTDTNAGSSLARRVSFRNVNTYVIDDSKADEIARSFSIVKDQLVDGFSRIKPESVNVINNKTIEMLVPDIRKKACEKAWTPTIASLDNPGFVTTKATEKGCEIAFTPSATINAGTTVTLTTGLMKTPLVNLAFSFTSPQFTK